MDIRFGLAEGVTICGAVTGPSSVTVFNGGPASVPYFIWNGSNWALASNPDNRVQRGRLLWVCECGGAAILDSNTPST